MKNYAQKRMLEKLAMRSREGSLRSLQFRNNLYDFSSNDYLSFARSPELNAKIQQELAKHPQSMIGSTGSRLLSGNSKFAENLEKELASYHSAENSLMFTSGYAANSSLFSAVPQKGDTVIHDEFIHGSVIDGIQSGYATRRHFKHNDLDDLEYKIKRVNGVCFVAVESIYSMDGDMADLIEIAKICHRYGAQLIVDEAHAFGVWGLGLVDELNIHHVIYARVVTFSKALGLHGAIVLGPDYLKQYLINFARPFIYTTAPPFNHLVSIQVAYQHLLDNPQFGSILHKKATLFKDNMPPQDQLHSTKNPSGIQCVFLEGNNAVVSMEKLLSRRGFDVGAIRSPTVSKGKERIRVCIHTHNSDEEILELCAHFNQLSLKK